MRLRISRLEEQAKERPAGYLHEVISRGEINGDWLEISSEDLAELREIYRPKPPPAPAEPPLPSLKVMAKSLAAAAVSEVSARVRGVPALDDSEIARRLAICRAPCEFYRPSDDRCSQCGCFERFKTTLRSLRCPKGFW